MYYLITWPARPPGRKKENEIKLFVFIKPASLDQIYIPWLSRV